jgi:hypothetical protein
MLSAFVQTSAKSLVAGVFVVQECTLAQERR